MRILINVIVVLVLISLFSCRKDTSPIDSINSEYSSSDDSNIPDSIRSSYKTDAARLAFRELFKNNLGDTSSVIIPETLINTFYDDLILIYNCKKISSVDTITKIHPVHTYPYRSLKRIVVGLDTSYAWTDNWLKGIKITGNDKIDSLVNNFELELNGIIVHRFAVLSSNTNLNMLALGNKFMQIPGVTSAEPDGAAGSGNDIEVNLYPNNKHYTFTIGWGDCPSGCTSSRIWEFNVTANGEVKFLGSYGNPLP